MRWCGENVRAVTGKGVRTVKDGVFGSAVMVVTVVKVEIFERVERVVGETYNTASAREMSVNL